MAIIIGNGNPNNRNDKSCINLNGIRVREEEFIFCLLHVYQHISHKLYLQPFCCLQLNSEERTGRSKSKLLINKLDHTRKKLGINSTRLPNFCFSY